MPGAGAGAGAEAGAGAGAGAEIMDKGEIGAASLQFKGTESQK